MNKQETRWFRCAQPNPQAQVRLFCFHHAGGGASAYVTWPVALPQVELYAVQLPGRETRLREQPLTQMAPVVEALYGAILPYLDKPFAFFGHSMGSLIAFELAHTIRRCQGVQPTHLCVSGRRAPHLPEPFTPLHCLPDHLLLTAIQQRYGGIPTLILQDAELQALFAPVLRADLTLVETYQPGATDPLTCPIVAFGGERDPQTPAHALLAWRTLTANDFSLHLLPGGHFYLNEQRALLLARLQAVLLECPVPEERLS